MQNWAMPDSVIILGSEADTIALAARLAGIARAGDVLLLSGSLGAGKTSFARAFIRARLGRPGMEVPSPTFTLVQTYQAADVMLWHYDLWRLAGPEALEELAWDEAQTGIILVEWPERLGDEVPTQALAISISLYGSGREIRLQGEQRWFDAS